MDRANYTPRLNDDSRTVTVRVPITINRRGGRKLVIAPNGEALKGAPTSPRVDNAMVKALARAFRWRDMLESGACATIREIAAAEKINESYISRVLRLTLLAPDIVEAIVKRQYPKGLQLDALMRRFPIEWQMQSCHIMPQCWSNF